MQKSAEQVADELLAKAGMGRASRKKARSTQGPALILPPPSAPVLVARHFIEARCLHNGAAGELTLRYWCGSWWLWKTTHWSEAEHRTVRSLLYDFTADAVYLNGKGLPEPW